MVSANLIKNLKEKNVTSGPEFEEAVRGLFAELDADGNKSLDIDELTDGVAKLGFTMTKAEVEKLLADADDNNDGTIDEKEFVAIVQSLMQK
mmetsp:Transcript_22442/g.55318  ORF Transcript_22442/g.55318 Transcript_22442/m.55318 type:complete len:92 (+) Transcript_22442:39-314(+)|eukprot:CAMPEP_0206253498 /NCGR_PEP_ID=MMETSP0047_2-20121206/23183_1 /ASSEMBLY_ACC=CAM_ASM_000192 /TAXON_ID=195065 /ORGANISM="Chroomonas mesostigmatica_cf, Strain CCMP1168" /LENGTH=91 /DNA_ID=CAMNT_0053679709 /DNA_START=32 /DNA_END=307 /DNA_ORIENTATION=-